MIGLVRAATVCATLALGFSTALAADKAFKRDDLADSAIKLEAQIKSEAGPVAKSAATLRSDADAAFKRNDVRSGLQILGQIREVIPAQRTPVDCAQFRASVRRLKTDPSGGIPPLTQAYIAKCIDDLVTLGMVPSAEVLTS